MPVPDRRQQLIAFFSADMARATEFKNRHQGQFVNGAWAAPRWPRYFTEVFNRILQRFDEELSERRLLESTNQIGRPNLWKINGDELLFRELVVPGEDGIKWLSHAVSAFVATVHQIDAELLPDGCGLRGCVWTAGFPIRNKEIRIPSRHSIPIIRLDDVDGDGADDGATQQSYEEEGFIDYLGPDMDLGFRLASVAPPGRTVCSLDVAYFLLQQPDSPSIYHVGWRSLKGIGGGAPYPVLWASTHTPVARHPWDLQGDDRELAEYLKGDAIQRSEFRRLAESYWTQLREYFQRPYTSVEDITTDHHQIWSAVTDQSDSELDPIVLEKYPTER